MATRLMLELAGARLVDGTVDVGGPGPAPATLGCATQKVTRAARHRRCRSASRPSCSSGSGSASRPRRRLDVTVPVVPAQRRHARGRPDRGGRAALGAREAARRRCPRHGANGRLTREQRLRRRAGDALVGVGFTRGGRLELPVAGDGAQAADLGRSPAGAPAQPALRGPVGHAHDAARLAAGLRAPQHARAGPRTCGCSRRARSTSTARTSASRRRPRRARTPLPDERMHLGRADDRAACGRRRGATTAPPSADFFAAKGVLETLFGALRVELSRRPRGRSVPAPGPRRPRAGRRRGRRLARRAAPGRRGRVGPRARVAGFELDLAGRARGTPSSAPLYEDLTSFPAIAPGPRVLDPRRSARRPSWSRSCAAPAASCCATCEVFDVYAREGQTSLARAARVPRRPTAR